MRADEITAKMGAGDTTTFQKAGRRILSGRNMELEVGGRSKREARSGGKRSMYGADAAGLRVLGGVGAMDGGWWWMVVGGGG